MGMAGPIFEPHPVSLKNSVFFEDKQMILVSFFDIFTGFKFQKNLKSLPIQFLSNP